MWILAWGNNALISLKINYGTFKHLFKKQIAIEVNVFRWLFLCSFNILRLCCFWMTPNEKPVKNSIFIIEFSRWVCKRFYGSSITKGMPEYANNSGKRCLLEITSFTTPCWARITNIVCFAPKCHYLSELTLPCVYVVLAHWVKLRLRSSQLLFWLSHFSNTIHVHHPQQF